MATTESEHGSAGRRPANVEKVNAPIWPIPFGFFPGIPSRTERAIAVSHSEETQKMFLVSALSRCAQLSVANVPPECEMSSTTVSRLTLSVWLLNWKPNCATAKVWPYSPSSLFAEIVTMLSFGKMRWRSEANCSPSQSDTSQPVTSRSTEPSCAPLWCRAKRSFILFVSVHAVIRLSERPAESQSSRSRLSTAGISRRSVPTGSLFGGGGGSMKRLPRRWRTRFAEARTAGRPRRAS